MELKAILVATDFSDCAGAAFRLAANLGRRFGAKLILLHVIHQRTVERLLPCPVLCVPLSEAEK